jgi:hypothetical protein
MTTYEAAIAAHNAAQAVYFPIRDGFLAGSVSDATYFAARKAYDAATADFDAAYAIEAAREDDAAEEAAADDQIAFTF